jgi:hypothetical protein
MDRHFTPKTAIYFRRLDLAHPLHLTRHISRAPLSHGRFGLPHSITSFPWLAIHNRFWMAGRLEKRGCYPLCKHLIFQCRFSKRVWPLVKDWVNHPNINLFGWTTDLSIKDWSLVDWHVFPLHPKPRCYGLPHDANKLDDLEQEENEGIPR